MNKCLLVMIERVDSRQPQSNWERLSKFQPMTACECASVGWLVHDGEDVKALAPNMADLNDDMQACGVIHIPTQAIRRIVPLVEERS